MSVWQRSQLQCRHEGRQHWLHAKQRTLSERQGPGRERRPKWRLLQGSKLSGWMQNDGIFASLVECVLRRSFLEHWRKNGIDPQPQPIKVEGRPGKFKPSISWVWGVRKRRPKCSLGHFQSELSLEIRLKRKPPPQENHWAKETGRLGDFSMWKHRKTADTHTHTHTQD